MAPTVGQRWRRCGDAGPSRAARRRQMFNCRRRLVLAGRSRSGVVGAEGEAAATRRPPSHCLPATETVRAGATRGHERFCLGPLPKICGAGIHAYRGGSG
jgi:hypothetical protein